MLRFLTILWTFGTLVCSRIPLVSGSQWVGKNVLISGGGISRSNKRICIPDVMRYPRVREKTRFKKKSGRQEKTSIREHITNSVVRDIFEKVKLKMTTVVKTY